MSLGSIHDAKATNVSEGLSIDVGGFSIGLLETTLLTTHLSPASAQLLHPSLVLGILLAWPPPFTSGGTFTAKKGTSTMQRPSSPGLMPWCIHFGCVGEVSSWATDRQPAALVTPSQRNHSQKQKGGKNVTLKLKIKNPTYSHKDP